MKHCTLRAMNPRHLALVFVVAWMGCSTNGAIDASSAPVDAFDAFDASTIEGNTLDAGTLDGDTFEASRLDGDTLDVGSFVEADANADAPFDEDAQPAREVGPSDAWVGVALDPDANTTDADAGVSDASVSDDANTSDANFDCGPSGPTRAITCSSVE